MFLPDIELQTGSIGTLVVMVRELGSVSRLTESHQHATVS
jgi:hypothetical protein